MKREVGLFGGISVLAGIMVGSGIFYIGGIVLQRAGDNLGLALLVWQSAASSRSFRASAVPNSAP